MKLQVLAAAGVALVALAGPAASSLEEFESWDLGAEELDDEYGLDALFVAPPPAWENEWQTSPEAVRLSLGCVTRELWEMHAAVKLERDIHPRAGFRYRFDQRQGLSVDDQQHWFGLVTRWGRARLGVFARPHSSKERHDFGLTAGRVWESGYTVEVQWSREDALNDFWTERSFLEERERVDFLSGRNEWRLRGARRWSPQRWIEGTIALLPETRRRIERAPAEGAGVFERILDGGTITVAGTHDLTPRSVHFTWKIRRRHTRFSEQGAAPPVSTDIRRLGWTARGRLDHSVHDVWRLAWSFQVRRNREEEMSPDTPRRLRTREVAGTVGIGRPLTGWLDAEIGYAHMDVNVHQSGAAPRFTHGTRSEGRIFVAGELRLGAARLRLVETLEVDGESYDVVGVHDKGFIQLQAAF